MARGDFIIDLDWEMGKLKRVVIRSGNGSPLVVKYGNIIKSIELKKENFISLDENLNQF